MDLKNEARQQKFREKMKSDGKRLRVFFLSDAAMDSIKILKEKTNAPGLNYALKSLLIGKTIEQDINNQAIIEQAKQVVSALQIWKKAPGSDAAKDWRRETEKLAALTDL